MPKLIEFEYGQLAFFNSITEASTYFIVEPDGKQTKIIIQADTILSSRPLKRIEAYLIKKLHNYARNF